MFNIYNAAEVTLAAKELFKEERAKTRVDGWFLAREIVYSKQEEFSGLSKEMRAAKELEAIVTELPLSISDNAIFAGSQSDAFARSYALINPSFKVETFSGYCDPTAVYNDIEPNDEFTKERIDRVAPFYLYVNVTTPDTLRKVLANPQKYAPSGVYIMRIHGTFVNFLDLSPAIQQDIIKRLDPNSTQL